MNPKPKHVLPMRRTFLKKHAAKVKIERALTVTEELRLQAIKRAVAANKWFWV